MIIIIVIHNSFPKKKTCSYYFCLEAQSQCHRPSFLPSQWGQCQLSRGRWKCVFPAGVSLWASSASAMSSSESWAEDADKGTKFDCGISSSALKPLPGFKDNEKPTLLKQLAVQTPPTAVRMALRTFNWGSTLLSSHWKIEWVFFDKHLR